MSLTGKAAAESTLRGKITRLEVIHTDTYQLAVKNGFEGTIDEWLASLIPVKGKDYYTEEDIKYVVDEVLKLLGANISAAKIGVVDLLANKWVGEDNLYSQIVDIDGVTEYSQVDLTPGVEQLAVFYEKDLAFVTENEGGVVTVYAIGQKPTNDYTIQVTITEVNV